MNRVLLLVEHRRNRELLREWLEEQEEYLPVDAGSTADLVLADAAALVRSRERIDAVRDGERPAYVPLLLVASPREAPRLPRDVWQVADEILTTPVRRAELSLRVGRLVALRRQSAAIARRLEELGRSNVDLEQFAYVAAHELATPLAVVLGALETITGRYREELGSAMGPLLDAAEEEGARLQTLIHDLLAFSQTGRTLDPAPVELDEIVRETLAALALQIEAAAATVEVDSLPAVRGDARQLRIVFANLLGNAIKYGSSERAPRIHVACDDEGAHWRISVEDNGRGVAPALRAAIFEMFDRGDGGRQSGHGIGLALCKRVVERHDGRIWVEPGAEHGSVFRFTLPKA